MGLAAEHCGRLESGGCCSVWTFALESAYWLDCVAFHWFGELEVQKGVDPTRAPDTGAQVLCSLDMAVGTILCGG